MDIEKREEEKHTVPLSPASKLPTHLPGNTDSGNSTFRPSVAKPETHYSVAGEDGRRRSVGPIVPGWWERRRFLVLGRASLALRCFGLLFSLFSFSVMASDRTQGWSGDSYYRYKEYRYAISVTIITFIYSGLQLLENIYHITKGKPPVSHSISLFFTFVADQVLSYLLVSASSSAASLIEETKALWGKDPFTDRASAAVTLAFFTFIFLALSSLISAHRWYNESHV